VSLKAQIVRRIRALSVLRLVRFSCWVALVGLVVMCSSIVFPNPLLIIFAMSAGQVIGIIAVLCYGLSVFGDMVRGADHPPDAPGPARRFRAATDEQPPTTTT
jgi:hypothetical protein